MLLLLLVCTDLKKLPTQPRAPPIQGSISGVNEVPKVVFNAEHTWVPTIIFFFFSEKYPNQKIKSGSIFNTDNQKLNANATDSIFNNPALKGVSFGATSILILIGVALDFTRRMESQMVMRHYEGFLK